VFCSRILIETVTTVLHDGSLGTAAVTVMPVAETMNVDSHVLSVTPTSLDHVGWHTIRVVLYRDGEDPTANGYTFDLHVEVEATLCDPNSVTVPNQFTVDVDGTSNPVASDDIIDYRIEADDTATITFPVLVSGANCEHTVSVEMTDSSGAIVDATAWFTLDSVDPTKPLFGTVAIDALDAALYASIALPESEITLTVTYSSSTGLTFEKKLTIQLISECANVVITAVTLSPIQMLTHSGNEIRTSIAATSTPASGAVCALEYVLLSGGNAAIALDALTDELVVSDNDNTVVAEGIYTAIVQVRSVAFPGNNFEDIVAEINFIDCTKGTFALTPGDLDVSVLGSLGSTTISPTFTLGGLNDASVDPAVCGVVELTITNVQDDSLTNVDARFSGTGLNLTPSLAVPTTYAYAATGALSLEVTEWNWIPLGLALEEFKAYCSVRFTAYPGSETSLLCADITIS